MAADVSVPNDLSASANSHADNTDANYAALVSWLNTNAVHLDGSKAFTSIPSGPASDPTTSEQFTRKAYVDALYAKPALRASKAAAQVFETGIESQFEFDTVSVDTGDFMDAPPQLDILVPVAGTYAVSLKFETSSSHTGTLTLRDGVGRIAIAAATSSTYTFFSFNVYLVAGVELGVWYLQSSGSDKNCTVTFDMVRLTT